LAYYLPNFYSLFFVYEFVSHFILFFICTERVSCSVIIDRRNKYPLIEVDRAFMCNQKHVRVGIIYYFKCPFTISCLEKNFFFFYVSKQNPDELPSTILFYCKKIGYKLQTLPENIYIFY